jgi:hypothetical protein
MCRAVDPARERIVVERPTPNLGPSHDAGTGRFEQLESNGPAGLLLNDDGPATDATAADMVADLELDVAQPRSLLSMARSNIAWSRTRRSRSSQNRMAQTC